MRIRVVALLALISLSAAAERRTEPRIEGLAATMHGAGRVNVRFQLADAFQSNNTVQALQSGLPTSFTYVIEIYRSRSKWFDEGIDRSRIEVIASFNSVTREYLLNYRRDRKLVRSETLNDLATLQARMTTIDEPGLFDIGGRGAHRIRVRVKADFGRGFLLYVIPWKISTPWREVPLASPSEVTSAR